MWWRGGGVDSTQRRYAGEDPWRNGRQCGGKVDSSRATGGLSQGWWVGVCGRGGLMGWGRSWGRCWGRV